MSDDKMKTGSFGWTELMTTDVAAAKAFYTKLFGWKTEKMPVKGEPEPYTLIRLGKEGIGGMMKMPADCPDKTPHWAVYVMVDDVDATASKVAGLGGKVLCEPTDIPDIGRFCVIQDPQGAVISAFEPKPM